MNNNYIEVSLKEWGITIEQAQKMKHATKVIIHLKYPHTEELMKLRPEERKTVMIKIFKDEFLALKNDFNRLRFKRVDKRVEPRLVKTQIELKQVFELLDKSYVSIVNIEEIEGFEKQESKKSYENTFYSVKAKFGIRIEGIEKGSQSWEERIILLRADNYKHAYDKALELLSLPTEPYLNPNKRFVWWKFENILDVCETSIQQVNDFEKDGVEVYFRMHNRRLKPEYIWKLDYE